MPFCPKCFREFSAAESVCPDCRQPLVRSLPPDPRQGELFEAVELYQIPDEIMGLALKSFLADLGIDSSLQEMRASFYGSILNPGQAGYWGKLLVAKEQEAGARRALAQFLREFTGR
jgi:hypothetical protein